MKTIETVVYEFDELKTEKAKDAARTWFRAGNYFYERYSQTVEDAKQAGITLKEWDTDARNNVHNMQIAMEEGALNTMNYILDNHGADCDTYKAAKAYEDAIDALPELPPEDAANYNEVEHELCCGADAIEGDFIEALEACYKHMLQDEFEHRNSDEYADESIRANEYSFTEDGKRFG